MKDGLEKKWLLRAPSPDSAGRLFVLPYMGAGASMFHAWPRWLGSIEVCPIQPPGREDRFGEPVAETYGIFVREMLAAIAPALDRPFSFFGHCASAYIALEAGVAASETMGRQAQRIFVSSMFSPDRAHQVPILALDKDEVWSLASDILKRRHGHVEDELVELAAEAILEDLRSYRAYAESLLDNPHLQSPCPLTVIQWDRDKFVPESDASSWRAHADDFEAVVLPGDHWSFLSAPPALTTILRLWGDD